MKVRSLRKKQGRLGFSALAVVGVLASLFVATPVSAASTGTGGLFVPATARILDTAAGVGGVSTPMPAGAYRTVKVAGVDGPPARLWT